MTALKKRMAGVNYIGLLIVIVGSISIGEVGKAFVIPLLDLRQEAVIITDVDIDRTTVKAGEEVKITIHREKLLDCPMTVVSYWESEKGIIKHLQYRDGYGISPAKKKFTLLLKIPASIKPGVWKWHRTLQHECKIDTKPTRFGPVLFTVIE